MELIWMKRKKGSIDTEIEKQPDFSRRSFLKIGARATTALTMVPVFHGQVRASELSKEGQQINVADPAQEGMTPEQIALYAPVTGKVSESCKARVEYKLSGQPDWVEAANMWRIEPKYSGKAVADGFAGVIFDLLPGKAYDIRVTFDDDVVRDVRQLKCATRHLPAARGPTTVQVIDEEQLQAAMHAALPGDVIQIMNDITIKKGKLWSNASGTEENPIYICGSGRDDITLTYDSTGSVFRPRATNWWVYEDFTIRGPGTDGRNPYSTAIQFWNGAKQIGNCFRRLKVTGFDRAILADNVLESTLVYDCIFEGNNPWDLKHAGKKITWNDDGLRLPGFGNCAFNNDLTGFGDSCALKGGIRDQRSIYFYRNKIRNSCDDAFEAEYGTRNYAFYDNQVTNCGIGVSFDGVYGGPLYLFRNRFINTVRGILKCGDKATGVLIWNNTFVSTKGTKNGFGLYFASARVKDWEYRNNLFLWEGDAEILWFDGRACSVALSQWRCEHNGWGRNGQVFHYVCGPTGDLAKVHAALTPIHDNDVDLSGQSAVFAVPVPLGADYLTEIADGYNLELSDTSEALGAGSVLPGISSHADLGAVGYGQTLPVVGDRQNTVVMEPPVDPPACCMLAAIAAALSPGESADFPEGEVPDSMMEAEDLAWQSHWHFDPNRNECSLLGDAPGGGADNSLIHARYDLEANKWTLIGKDIFPQKLGHLYGNNADDGKGNIYFKPYNSSEVAYYDREADTWDLDRTVTPNRGFRAGPRTSVGGGGAFHPGIGNQGGLIWMGRTRIYVWDKGLNAWRVLMKTVDSVHGDNSYGIARYVPGLDKVILGRKTLFSIDANLTVKILGTPPIEPFAGSIGYGGSPVAMMLHPSNDSMLVLIERAGSGKDSKNGDVYSSIDGINWTHRGDHNPFTNIGKQGSTICSLTNLGVFWAMGKKSPVGTANSVVWKPGF